MEQHANHLFHDLFADYRNICKSSIDIKSQVELLQVVGFVVGFLYKREKL